MPILIGGAGEKVTLRIVAEHANLWNTFGPPENFAKKNAILTEWCGKVGRDPAEIERTVMIRGANDVDRVEDYLEAGAQHIILGVGTEGEEPIDLKPFSGCWTLEADRRRCAMRGRTQMDGRPPGSQARLLGCRCFGTPAGPPERR